MQQFAYEQVAVARPCHLCQSSTKVGLTNGLPALDRQRCYLKVAIKLL